MHQIYPWQQQQWQNLFVRRQNDSLPHALLLSGQNGLGKLEFANCLAAAVLCNNKSEFPCGQCKSCHLLLANNHPDLFVIQPEEKSTAIKIDQIRELVTTLGQTSLQGGYKIVIIEPADYMNVAAANALLKTLEEPSGRTLFILLTSMPTVIPATIRSRCQQIVFNVPPFGVSVQWLQGQLPASADVQVLLELAEDVPLKALQLAQSAQVNQNYEFIKSLLTLSSGKTDPLKVATTLTSLDFQTLIIYWMTLVGDLVKLKSNFRKIKNSVLQKELAAFSVKVELDKLFLFFDNLVTLRGYLINNININIPLQTECLVLRWQEILC
jgi:DNA polymerase III subunit delta'